MSVAAEQPRASLYRRVAGLFFSKLARASAWLFVGSIAGGILGYVFHVLMGRMLSTQEYGLFSAMMAFFAVFNTPLGTLMMVVSRKVSEYRARQDAGSISHFYYSINIRTAAIGALLLGIYLLFAPQVQSYLKAPSVIPVYLLGALLFLTFLPVINNAFLQGLQRFIWFSASGVLGVMLKIIFSVVLVWLGYGLTGAVGGVVLTSLAMWFITYGALYRPLARGRNKPYLAAHLSIRPALPVLTANAAFAAMTQLDMVLVNYYFPAHEAGLYAAASILGKAVMYLPGGFALALFPMVAENHTRGQSSAHLLLQAVGLTAVLCGAGAVFYFLFGEEIIVLLYGEDYRGAGEVLKFFGFAILPMALVMVAEYFLIAKGRVLFAYLFVFTAPLQLTAIYFYHDSLQMVVAVMGASGLLLAILGYGVLWREFRRS
ncbi:MAG: oligosaccharide flippase family protein [Gallionellaceae bacterium]|nr:oligosaccharide flippase family protein [Gallionellaceae bacterium]